MIIYSNNNCFDSNRTQFFVTIDGIRYPKQVPLYENKSIDFKCLNSTNKPKTILGVRQQHECARHSRHSARGLEEDMLRQGFR